MEAGTGSEQKIEYKEFIGEDQLRVILEQWLSALEDQQDLHLRIDGKDCHIPKEAFKVCKTKAEYEFKNGQYELELELKWTNSDLKLS